MPKAKRTSSKTIKPKAVETPLNYYEFLQISPNAEHDTIQRVYRFLAVRFHPDNPETGNADKFHTLKQAYEVLSNPERRAEYDASYKQHAHPSVPLSSTIDFMDDMKGELNRRLALLGLLYLRRRQNPGSPEVALSEVEMRMGFPREYLEFTVWYLQKKGFITRADNSAFTLTAEGVDFVEAERRSIPALNKLLTTGPETPASEVKPRPGRRRKPAIAPALNGAPLVAYQ